MTPSAVAKAFRRKWWIIEMVTQLALRQRKLDDSE